MQRTSSPMTLWFYRAVPALIVLLFSIAGGLGGIGAERAFSPPPRLIADGDLTIPLRYEGLYFTDVKVNDSAETFNFLVDSGATNSVLSRRVAALLNIQSMEMGEGRGVGTQKVALATGVQLSVAGEAWKDRPVIVTDLSAVADVMGKHMDGILGADWLMQFEVCRFDFIAHTLTLKKYGEGRKARRGLTDLMKNFGGLGGGGNPGDAAPGDFQEMLDKLLRDFLGGGEGAIPGEGGLGGLDKLLEELLRGLGEGGAIPGDPRPPKDDNDADDGNDDGSGDPFRDLFDELRRKLEEGGVPIPPDFPKGGGKGKDDGEEDFSESPPSMIPMELNALVWKALGSAERNRNGGSLIQAAPNADEDNESSGENPPFEHRLPSYPTERLTLPFRQVDVSVPLVGDVVVVTLWFVDIEVDGKAMTVIFDTGAMPLLVLNKSAADTLDIGRACDFPVSGLGTGMATLGIANHLKVGAYAEDGENPCAIMDLSHTFRELQENFMMKIIGALGAKIPEVSGLVGLPFAARYAAMTVDHSAMTISFEPFAAKHSEQRGIHPLAEGAYVLTAVKKAWRGVAGDPGFEGHDLPFDDWKRAEVSGGIVIDLVKADSGADRAGLVAGDILYAITDKDPVSEEEIEHPFRGVSGVVIKSAADGAGATWKLKVKRADHSRESITLRLDPSRGEVSIPKRYTVDGDEGR